MVVGLDSADGESDPRFHSLGGSLVVQLEVGQAEVFGTQLR